MENDQELSQVQEYNFEEQTFIERRANNYLPNNLVVSHAKYGRIEQKIFEFFINQIDFEKSRDISSTTGLIIKIPLKYISKHIKYADLKTHSATLGAKPITIEEISIETKKEKFTHLFPFIKIEYNPDQGFLEFYTNPQISPYLFFLEKQYARYKFENVLSFKSIYTTPMYRLLRMHIGQNRNMFVYSIEEIRKILGVDADKYTNFKDFKKYVIEPAKREMAESTFEAINFEYESTGKKLRNVSHLTFTILDAITVSHREKEELSDALKRIADPDYLSKAASVILARDYNMPNHLMSKILMDGELLTRFVTLDIELNNGVYPKVKNRTAWILACLNLVKKKVKQAEYKPLF